MCASDHSRAYQSPYAMARCAPPPTGFLKFLGPGILAFTCTSCRRDLRGQPVAVTFAGLSPASVGLLQVNLLMPLIDPGHTYPLQVSVNKISSNTRMVTVSRGWKSFSVLNPRNSVAMPTPVEGSPCGAERAPWSNCSAHSGKPIGRSPVWRFGFPLKCRP
jgi:hypothetical protein